jgi:hypothetical protein
MGISDRGADLREELDSGSSRQLVMVAVGVDGLAAVDVLARGLGYLPPRRGRRYPSSASTGDRKSPHATKVVSAKYELGTRVVQTQGRDARIQGRTCDTFLLVRAAGFGRVATIERLAAEAKVWANDLYGFTKDREARWTNAVTAVAAETGLSLPEASSGRRPCTTSASCTRFRPLVVRWITA